MSAVPVSEDTSTNTCRAWKLERADGLVLGFTDHDCLLEFDQTVFRPDGGMTASAIESATGFSVDNAEAFGVLSADSIAPEDIHAGLYDAAKFKLWRVNWQDVQDREILFSGQIGDIRQSGGAFQAELRGLTDLLNQPRGRTYQKSCGANLGDRACGVYLEQPLFRLEGTLERVLDNRVLLVRTEGTHDAGWFTRGVVRFPDWTGQLGQGLVKTDGFADGFRRIELWHPLTRTPEDGAAVEVLAGCDKLSSTCRFKFQNLTNFRGFPDLPGDDWMLRYPNTSEPKDGGSRR